MKYILSFLALLIFMHNASLVYAVDITVSDNGSGSENSVTVTENSETVISQQNIAEVQNTVTQNISTGNNSSSANLGDTSIITGNSEATLEIENSLNTSTIADDTCCSQDSTISIDSNGSGSVNTIVSAQNTSKSLTVINTATVQNHVKGEALTGNNTTLGNNGHATIATGSIMASEKIINAPINLINIDLSDIAASSTVIIRSNGSGSTNIVSTESDETTNTHILNSSTVTNASDWLLSSGGNSGLWNVGDFAILTGDIRFNSEIVNGPMNFSNVEIDSCCAFSDPEDVDLPVDEDGTAIGGISITNNPIVQAASISMTNAVGGILGLSDTSGYTSNLWMASFMIMAAGVRLLNLGSVIKSSSKEK